MAYGAAIALSRSIAYILDIGVEEIFAHNRILASQLIEGMQARGAEILPELADGERCSIVSARFPGQDSSALACHLNENRVVVSARGGLIRFSPHLYNDATDIERALRVIDQHAP
jgi:selenocysteine lyase/cysteine desulfurase